MHSALPMPVQAYITATNAFDIEALVAAFSADALVNDHRNEFLGQEAIRSWAQREIIDDRVTMQVTHVTRCGMTAAITASLAGNFDKTGLPDPLLLTFYFAFGAERIDQLIIVQNKPVA